MIRQCQRVAAAGFRLSHHQDETGRLKAGDELNGILICLPVVIEQWQIKGGGTHAVAGKHPAAVDPVVFSEVQNIRIPHPVKIVIDVLFFSGPAGFQYGSALIQAVKIECPGFKVRFPGRSDHHGQRFVGTIIERIAGSQARLINPFFCIVGGAADRYGNLLRAVVIVFDPIIGKRPGLIDPAEADHPVFHGDDRRIDVFDNGEHMRGFDGM